MKKGVLVKEGQIKNTRSEMEGIQRSKRRRRKRMVLDLCSQATWGDPFFWKKMEKGCSLEGKGRCRRWERKEGQLRTNDTPEATAVNGALCGLSGCRSKSRICICFPWDRRSLMFLKNHQLPFRRQRGRERTHQTENSGKERDHRKKYCPRKDQRDWT